MINYTRAVAECTGGAELDEVDAVIDQWQTVRPDLDLSGLGWVARLKQLSAVLAGSADRVLERHGLSPGEFDVLAALRRAGPPHTLIPSQLSAALMMSRAGMTSRLDRLEAAGLVERSIDPSDRRSFRVALTDKGLEIIDEALTDHAENVARLSSCLSPEQRAAFDDVLRTMLRNLA